MNIYHLLRQDVITAALKILKNIPDNLLNSIVVEMPKEASNGDLSTNAAMVLAKDFKKNPREIATLLTDYLSSLPYIDHIEIAGPGFINFTINPQNWYDTISDIIDLGEKYGRNNMGLGVKINVEYASPNPTGPMHIGHARGAVYGDALARLLVKCGYDVTKEYYVNDAGGQVLDLARTVFLRYKEAYTGEKAIIPAGLYPGDYLCPIGQKLANTYGDKFLNMTEAEYLPIIKKIAIQEMLETIKGDLLQLGVQHDIFFSEQSLYDNNKVEEAVNKLKKLDLVYEGILPPPKGELPENWESREQLLFRSTNFGDDQDRALKKSDQSWTYFAGDIGYTADKIARGFNEVIFVLGADHGGYVKRIKAVVESLSEGKVKSEVKLCQMVNFVENGVPIKMSKRAGAFTTTQDVVNEVGKDVIRFIMLTRKNDAILDFDLIKVKEQSKDNPVFYVQYAYVRALSIISNAHLQLPESYNKLKTKQYDLTLLSSKEELELIKLLASFPKIIEGAALHFEPHRIAFYLQSIASLFHSLWNLGKENNNYRFIIENDIELTAARLAMVHAMSKVLHAGFDIIGVDVIEKM